MTWMPSAMGDVSGGRHSASSFVWMLAAELRLSAFGGRGRLRRQACRRRGRLLARVTRGYLTRQRPAYHLRRAGCGADAHVL